jgi:hypothetical protein
MNTRTIARTIIGLTVFTTSLFAQGAYTPYGIDLELIGNCSQSSCLLLDDAVQARAQWVRIFVPWNIVEPTAPTGAPTGAPGFKSGSFHNYDWGFPDGMIQPALNRGLNVYVQIYFTASWANGNPYTNCEPVNNRCPGNAQGWIPNKDPNNTGGTGLYLQDFAYNLAVRYPQVQYFGPLNEPNFTNNFNVVSPLDPGSYLNYYMEYFAFPVQTGIKLANPGNQLVGPDVGLSQGASSGLNSWINPIMQYFPQTFDVLSVHTYHSDHTGVRDDLDSVETYARNYGKLVWLTETGFGACDLQNQANQLQGVYVDEFNRQTWWTKTFYHTMQVPIPNCSQDDSLADPSNNFRPAFFTFQSLYNH